MTFQVLISTSVPNNFRVLQDMQSLAIEKRKVFVFVATRRLMSRFPCPIIGRRRVTANKVQSKKFTCVVSSSSPDRLSEPLLRPEAKDKAGQVSAPTHALRVGRLFSYIAIVPQSTFLSKR